MHTTWRCTVLGVIAIVAWAIPATAQPDVRRLVATDLDGHVHRLGGTPQSAGLVLVFLGTECPISNRYAPELGRLAARARKAGIDFAGIVSDPSVTRRAARAHAAEYALAFPVLFDGSGVLAATLGPSHVPEAFAFDRGRTLVYRGRIDDRYIAVGRPRARVTERDLARAIDALADGRSPAPHTTVPVGCPMEAWTRPDARATVTWTRDIAPIIRGNCLECHRDGGLAPFALDTYESVAKRARFIARVTADRTMPPWKAEPGYGSFRDVKRLDARAIALFAEWANGGTPRGDDADALPPLPSRPRWRLGTPDLVLRPKNPERVPAEGLDHLRDYTVPIPIDRRRIVTAIEYRPGAPRTVHHAIFALNYRFEDGEAMMDPIGGYAPGADEALVPGSGMGIPIEPGSTFAMLTHYFPRGKAEVDEWEIGLHFATGPVEHIIRWLPLGSQQIDIPAGDARHEIRSVMSLPVAVTVYKLFPHFHLLARETKLRAILPDGREVPLLWIRDWDMHWQQMYTLREPLRLPAGSRFEMYTRYDNSRANPRNPHDPPRRVTLGGNTHQEMCECYAMVTTDDDASFDTLVPHVIAMRTGMTIEQARALHRARSER